MPSLVPRHAEGVARELLTHAPGLVIEGARQVGKSTLAAQLVFDSDAVVVSLDDEQTRAAALEDAAGFVCTGG